MLKSKLSLSRHFEYANKQITCHFWLCGADLVWGRFDLLPKIVGEPHLFDIYQQMLNIVLQITSDLC
jgi:hypothetical protein